MLRQTIKEAYEENVDSKWNSRDFVSDILSYANSSYKKILVVSGLRGTGKTCGILQALKEKDAFYYKGQKDDPEPFSVDTFEKELSERPEKYIILDEYPWIGQTTPDRDRLDKFLSTLVENGKRIIVSGTESLVLEQLKYGDFIHRGRYIHTNYFSFDEYCRLWNLNYTKENCERFLLEGGVFPEYLIKQRNEMKSYIKNSIIDQLVSYIPGDKYSEEYIEAVIYSIFYKAIRESCNERIPVYKTNGRTLEDMLESFGVDPSIQIDASDFKQISEILETIQVIFTAKNYRNKAIFQTYLVNPSLSAQMLKEIYNISTEEISHDMLGYLFEATCAAGLYYTKEDDKEIYYMSGRREGKDFQIDFILQDTYNKDVVLFEFKLSDNKKIYPNNSIVLDAVQSCFSGDVVGRYILSFHDPAYDNVNGKDILYLLPHTPIPYWDFEKNIQNIK